jgi:hypothetical protein
VTADRLEKLQSTFSEFLMYGFYQDELLEQLASTSDQQSVQRLDVYRNGYFIRLEAALAHDFPACERILGRAEFVRHAGDYVVALPSISPSLRNLGHGFAGWLRAHAGAAIADLADIEWAVMQVFDGPDCVAADSTSMEQFAPEDWAMLRVALVPTLTLLSLTSNADDVWNDHQDEINLQSSVARSLAISRNDKFQPNLTVIDDHVFRVLYILNEEVSLAVVSESLADLIDVAEVPQLLAKVLLTAFAHDWVASVGQLKLEHLQ